MLEPTSTAIFSAVCATINTTVEFAKCVYELKNTPIDVKTCLDLVARVDDDIQYAITLREKHLKHLSSTPDELRRLNGIIASATQSILDVGRLLEGCRRESHGGQVPMKGRMKWLMSDSIAFSKRTPNLQQQHAAINVEIMFLRQLGALRPFRDLTNNTTFENPELFSMSRRKSSSLLSTSGEEEPLSPPEYSPPVPRHSVDESLSSGSITRPGKYHESSTLIGCESHPELDQYIEEGNGCEEEDPEVAYYRELRQQEQERRQRRAAQENNR